MPDLDDKERLVILQQNADKIEPTTYQKPLTDEELRERKDNLTDNSIKLGDLEEQKQEAVKDFKAQIDPLKDANKQLLQELRTKQAKVEGTLYHIANHDESMMGTYDQEGNMISSRRLFPNEKQGRMQLSIAK